MQRSFGCHGVIQKLKDKWAETLGFALKGEVDLANQHSKEAKAIIETLNKILDKEPEEAQLDKNKAGLELAQYKLRIFDGTEAEEYKTSVGYYQARTREYQRGERIFQDETENLIKELTYVTIQEPAPRHSCCGKPNALLLTSWWGFRVSDVNKGERQIRGTGSTGGKENLRKIERCVLPSRRLESSLRTASFSTKRGLSPASEYTTGSRGQLTARSCPRSVWQIS